MLKHDMTHVVIFLFFSHRSKRQKVIKHDMQWAQGAAHSLKWRREGIENQQNACKRAG